MANANLRRCREYPGSTGGKSTDARISMQALPAGSFASYSHFDGFTRRVNRRYYGILSIILLRVLRTLRVSTAFFGSASYSPTKAATRSA